MAEGKALREGLKLLMKEEYLEGENIWKMKIFGDSELIIKLVQNRWICNNSNPEIIVKEIKHILSHFQAWNISDLGRGWNTWADLK
eukprot:Gb_20247 [translate_table: standard]